ncbi:hypothetical protein [Paraburkholderia phenoliruptrix]|nr:hypothetical protein [Paraburkholderia phenoliruptrix]WMY10967.1 hypothetical protein P3F88_30270 [Paraburkholderia phenoliruptrix]
MDAQIDYAAGMPLAVLQDAPVIDPTIPSPDMLCGSDPEGEVAE